jgi:hypothetical protein
VYQMQLFGNGLPDIKGWSIAVAYDAEQVRYVANSFAAGSFLPGLIALTTDEDGLVNVGGSLLGASAGSSGDGFLGSLRFEVLDGFAGSTDLVITETNQRLSEGGQEKTAVVYTATISAELLTTRLPGDFDGSGKVDFTDFFMFADSFGGTDPTFDLDSDGKVGFGDFFIFADNFGAEARAKLFALAEELIGLPRTASLEPNYPNPFNTETVLPYQISMPGAVQIKVYDLSGQVVRKLTNSYHTAGRYTVSWDGTNEQTDIVSSGVYLISLQTEITTETRKIMLMK